ncbi:hypothetical protein G9409_01835 [Chlorobium sp. BLA1]|uniref:hypothetical protein n=1 Tax=Candidatus Chlorobium masyuteum TaxID=2716876 RepID=UPI0014224AEF|nr:hypothetical protein [Candidatus Chlorobium masyuteum]NHQ59344.1 hypothetical protein [Candidatus Chlorobium masyuteum]NTU45119.1 hypothetical protein [Chlorobiaceae bacterium]
MNTNTRFSASPFAIGAFILSAITALLFVLTVVTGMFQSAQLWLSALLVIAVVLHTAINWKQFT